MKKLYFIILFAISVAISTPSHAQTVRTTEIKNDDITISISVKDEKQSKEILEAVSKAISKSKPKNKTSISQSIFSKKNLNKLFNSKAFKDLGEKAIKIILIILIALFVKRAIKMAINIALHKVQDGKRLTKARKQKINTILPLINNTLNIVFFILVLLIILSELGIDIAPLLAGAGVIGLAIGFGAQTLVKDFITGFFILLESTISVGDVVEIGGITGTVESLSIKSVVLRDLHGIVHTIPFSEVKTISNKTKDFSYSVFEIGVAYRENIDEVIKEIKTIAKKMYTSKKTSDNLLGKEVEIFGVNELGDSAVVIKGRFKTKPGDQWAIGREFNRLVKDRFDELGIEIPFPHTTIYFGEDKEGNAPAAQVRIKDNGKQKK